MNGDLHCHSLYSDGSTDIETIITTAVKLKLSTIAVSDHDTFAQYPEAQKIADRENIRLLKACEISTRDPLTRRRVHILCYLPQDENPLNELFEITNQSREKSIEKSIEVISKDYPIDYEMLREKRGKYKSVFKQSIIALLMELGYETKIFGELFNYYFRGENPKALFPVEYPDVRTAIDTVRSCKGVAVMAHPGVYNSYELLENLCKENMIDGIEVMHTRNKEGDFEYLSSLADRYNLIKTGGSDFHGFHSMTPRPLGSCFTTDREVEKILEIAEKRK